MAMGTRKDRQRQEQLWVAHAELASGRDPAVALRTAKLALLHSKNAYERPFYWAPFILYGAP